MRHVAILTALFCCFAPAVCFGLAFCISGNEPQSSANYSDWPGLVDVVNDPSRECLCWCNGDERLWYRGDTETLNRVLSEFAEIEGVDPHVVILPGPGQILTRDGAEVPCDWRLRVVGGIARARCNQYEPNAVWDTRPTLTIFLTDRLNLDELTVPAGIAVSQWKDLCERYEAALHNDNEPTRKQAEQLLENLNTIANQEGDAADQVQERFAAIQAWAERRQNQRPE